MSRYSTVLFDLDGTLTDSAPGIINSVMHAAGKLGLDADPAELRSFVGPPLSESFMRHFGLSAEEADQAIVYYREYFSVTGLFENQVYDGVLPLLRELKAAGRTVILATSKPEVFAKRILEHFCLAEYFDFICGATLDSSRSEKADVIRYALASCSITELSDVIMVGDRLHDVIGARECGIDCIGVLYGYGSHEELATAGAAHIVSTADELLELLMK